MSASFVVGVFAAMALVMAAAWLVQRLTGNTGWVDVVWTFGTGLVGAATAFLAGAGDGAPWRRVLVAMMVTLWAARLGLHIAERVANGPEDGRYRALKERWGARYHARLFWFLEAQALVSTILAVAIAAAAARPGAGFRLGDALGLAVFGAAVLGEAVADRQLRAFKRDGGGHGRICDVGLWGWSRHPNYFFEWLGWVAYPLIAIDVAGGWTVGWLALAAPAVMYLVLVHGSGIPPVERQMAASRGAAFEDYRRRTSRFFPLPSRGVRVPA